MRYFPNVVGDKDKADKSVGPSEEAEPPGYNNSKRAVGVELTVAHGGWESSAHERYERFGLEAALNIAPAMVRELVEADATGQRAPVQRTVGPRPGAAQLTARVRQAAAPAAAPRTAPAAAAPAAPPARPRKRPRPEHDPRPKAKPTSTWVFACSNSRCTKVADRNGRHDGPCSDAPQPRQRIRYAVF